MALIASSRAAAFVCRMLSEEEALQAGGRRVGRCSCLVIPESRIERREIDRAVEEVIQCVLKRPGQELPREIDGQQLGIGVDVLVAGHGGERRSETTRCAATRSATSTQLRDCFARYFIP